MAPFPVSPELEKAFAAFATAASAVMPLLVTHLTNSDIDTVERMAEASTRGHRLMLAIDVDTNDCQVRLVAVSPDQQQTQLAALGAFPPSDRRH